MSTRGSPKRNAGGRERLSVSPSSVPASVERRAGTDEALAALLGRTLSDADLRALAGGVDGAQVSVFPYLRGAGVVFIATGPDESLWARSELTAHSGTGQVYLHLDNIRVAPSLHGQGTATRMLVGQVQALQRVSRETGTPINWLRLTAARSANAQLPMNGYYTWPRLGFDAMLSAQEREALPANLASARQVSDLMRSAEGRAWWKEHGTTTAMTFDARSGSTSERVLREYAASKGINWESA